MLRVRQLTLQVLHNNIIIVKFLSGAFHQLTEFPWRNAIINVVLVVVVVIVLAIFVVLVAALGSSTSIKWFNRWENFNFFPAPSRRRIASMRL
jgi:L-asparagine transporter-like permease